jgi:hypothetical protein
MTVLLHLSSAPLAWALEAARIFLVIFGCGASDWALGFGMVTAEGWTMLPLPTASVPTRPSWGIKESPVNQQRGSALNTKSLRDRKKAIAGSRLRFSDARQ